MPDDDTTSRRPTADEGTHLGASTNALTRVFAIVMWPLVATRRLGRAIARATQRIFGGDHRIMRALGARAAAFGQRVGRACAGGARAIGTLIHAAGRVLAPIARVLRSVGRVVTAIARAMAALLATVSTAVARVGRSAWNALTGASRASARRVARAVVAGYRIVARVVAALVQPVGRTLGAFGARVARAITVAATALGRTIARVSTAIAHAGADWSRRIAARIWPPLLTALRFAGLALVAVLIVVPYLIYLVGRALVRPLRAVVRAVAPPIRAAGRALTRPIGTAARAVGRVIRPPVQATARAVTACVRAIGESGRQFGGRVGSACRRVAHSVGVAYLRARLMHAHARTTATQVDPPVGAAVHNQRSELVPFEATVFQNEWLPRGGREVHAVITVTAHATPATADDATPEAAEVILLDCSGSMGHPWQKLRAARTATVAAIKTLRDGTWFAIVRASHVAEPVYPLGGGLVRATDQTRLDAISALGLLWPEGGTAMGQWLTLAYDLLDTQPHAIPHAILLTDGKNESETPAELEAALRSVAGRFQCDCRGVGTEWDVAELRTVSSRMLGTVDIVADPDDLAADFEAMTAAAMAKRVGDTRLRVWTPQGAAVHSLHQVAPEVQDLTPQRRPVDRQTGEYALGSWGDESRDYHLFVRVPDKNVGAEMLAARISVVVGEHVATTSRVRAIWTDDEDAATRISPQVADYTGQTELVTLIQEGVGARRAGDDDRATEKLGRAAQVAAASGNDETLKLLANVVDIIDAPTGRVRLRAHVELADEMALDTRSAKTVRVGT